MLKFNLIFKIYFSLFILWGIISLITAKDNLASDGYLEIGFPFTFYIDFHGKSSNHINTGLDIIQLIYNLSILLIITAVIVLIVNKKAKK